MSAPTRHRGNSNADDDDNEVHPIEDWSVPLPPSAQRIGRRGPTRVSPGELHLGTLDGIDGSDGEYMVEYDRDDVNAAEGEEILHRAVSDQDDTVSLFSLLCCHQSIPITIHFIHGKSELMYRIHFHLTDCLSFPSPFLAINPIRLPLAGRMGFRTRRGRTCLQTSSTL